MPTLVIGNLMRCAWKEFGRVALTPTRVVRHLWFGWR